MWKKLLGYPLFVAGVISLIAGIALNFYWCLLLGMFSMSYGALHFSENWG